MATSSITTVYKTNMQIMTTPDLPPHDAMMQQSAAGMLIAGHIGTLCRCCPAAGPVI